MSQAPLNSREVARKLKARPALKEAEIAIAFETPPKPQKAGVRLFPPPVKGTFVKRPKGKSSRVVDLSDKTLEGYLPDHLPFNPKRPVLEKSLKLRRFFDPGAKLKKGEHQATTVFPPDQRYVFSDTSFPWCTTGRVDLSGGWGSGTLVGPRHLLCASHMMTWNSDNTVNQVTFTPSYFNGNAPFGNSGIIHWYAYRKVVGPTISNDDIAEDYVVLVLSQRLGDLCGWMGSRGYSSSWNGQPYWSHIGYPGDIAGGVEPTFQNEIAVDNTSGGSDDEDLWHKADVWPGQSGGPFFGWWAGESWPRVVGVQSGQNSSTNSAGGGNDIPNLVNQARNDFP